MANVGALTKLASVLGKNSDEILEGIAKTKKGTYVQKELTRATNELQEEFNKVGTRAAKWGGVEDFSSLSESKQFSLVRDYNNRMDELRSMSKADRRAMIDEKLGRQADGSTKYSEANAQQKVATQERLNQIQREQELRQINNRDEYRKATRQNNGKPKVSAGEKAAAILNNPNSTPEAKAMANKVLDNQDVRLNSGRGGDNIDSKTRGKAAREAYEADHANRTPLTQDERIASKHNPTTKAAHEARMSDLEAKQKAADKAMNDARYQAKMNDNQAYADAQEKINKQNRPLVTRTVESLSEAGQAIVHFPGNVAHKVGSGVSGVATGRGRREAAQLALDYNDILRKNGATEGFIDIKGGKQLRSQYKGMTAQEIYDAQEAARIAAENSSGGFDWSGIGEWVHENQLLTAGAVVGVGLIGASLLDDDD